MLFTRVIYPLQPGFPMNRQPTPAYVAFESDRRIAAGSLRDVAHAAKEELDRHRNATILIFDGMTGSPVDIDLRGTVTDVQARLPKVAVMPSTVGGIATPRSPGRPKLGVVAREVTLLPRHWEWLARQPGGASVALRRLVDEARRSGEDRDGVREAQEAAYRFMSAMAGNRPRYEDAIRALFANDPVSFEQSIATWPTDIRNFALALAENAFRHDRRPIQVDPGGITR